jgi:hypothetical protein
MGKKVAKVRTPVSEPQMAQAIIEAWTEMFGAAPGKDQVSMLLAQNALETGNRKNMWNYNVGNIVLGGSAFNYIDDLVPDMKFRAYSNLKEGTKDYLKLLSNKHYSQAWQHIIHPDPAAFSKSLKAAGYYGDGSERAYTKALVGLYERFSKSNGYEQAKARPIARPQPVSQNTESTSNLGEILEKYFKMLTASTDHSLKVLYKKALPNHDILIKVDAVDQTSAIEFSRVLCSALDEDLLATAYTHTDGDLVEIECSIPGPAQECFDAVKQMTEAVAETFQDATSKIGGIKITTTCLMNKKSSYQPISFKTADTNYRKFLLKFI